MPFLGDLTPWSTNSGGDDGTLSVDACIEALTVVSSPCPLVTKLKPPIEND